MRVHIRNLRVPALVLPVVLTIGVVGAYADTIYVCWDGSGDYLTIQEGIDGASDGDEVVVCDGTYTGAGNKNLDYHAKAITVRSANGAETCIIDCEGHGEGFWFHSDETYASVVDGFTIRNAYGGLGGGIACYSSPTISNCTIASNTAYYGGGIGCSAPGNPTITGCTIVGNTADGGGAIMCDNGSSPTIINCAITGNTGTC